MLVLSTLSVCCLIVWFFQFGSSLQPSVTTGKQSVTIRSGITDFFSGEQSFALAFGQAEWGEGEKVQRVTNVRLDVKQSPDAMPMTLTSDHAEITEKRLIFYDHVRLEFSQPYRLLQGDRMICRWLPRWYCQVKGNVHIKDQQGVFKADEAEGYLGHTELKIKNGKYQGRL